MISILRGRVIKSSLGNVVIDVNGVGYGVTVSLNTFYKLPKNGSEAELKIHTQLRENSIDLYGFLNELEKDTFDELIGVTGIGPKGAINILSNITPEELADSVHKGDLARRKIPGIGPKTSKRIINELRDKLKIPVSSEGTSDLSLAEDIISALANLGFTRAEIDERFNELEKIIAGCENSEQAFKESLKIMKRG